MINRDQLLSIEEWIRTTNIYESDIFDLNEYQMSVYDHIQFVMKQITRNTNFHITKISFDHTLKLYYSKLFIELLKLFLHTNMLLLDSDINPSDYNKTELYLFIIKTISIVSKELEESNYNNLNIYNNIIMIYGMDCDLYEYKSKYLKDLI